MLHIQFPVYYPNLPQELATMVRTETYVPSSHGFSLRQRQIEVNEEVQPLAAAFW